MQRSTRLGAAVSAAWVAAFLVMTVAPAEAQDPIGCCEHVARIDDGEHVYKARACSKVTNAVCRGLTGRFFANLNCDRDAPTCTAFGIEPPGGFTTTPTASPSPTLRSRPGATATPRSQPATATPRSQPATATPRSQPVATATPAGSPRDRGCCEMNESSGSMTCAGGITRAACAELTNGQGRFCTGCTCTAGLNRHPDLHPGSCMEGRTRAARPVRIREPRAQRPTRPPRPPRD